MFGLKGLRASEPNRACITSLVTSAEEIVMDRLLLEESIEVIILQLLNHVRAPGEREANSEILNAISHGEVGVVVKMGRDVCASSILG